MAYLFLSGGAYGADWLPLILPLVGILFVLYTGDATLKYYKKWRPHKGNKQVNDLISMAPEKDGSGLDGEQ